MTQLWMEQFRLQRIVIERTKRLTGVTREVKVEEIFEFSHLRRVQAELAQSGWAPKTA